MFSSLGSEPRYFRHLCCGVWQDKSLHTCANRVGYMLSIKATAQQGEHFWKRLECVRLEFDLVFGHCTFRNILLLLLLTLFSLSAFSYVSDLIGVVVYSLISFDLGVESWLGGKGSLLFFQRTGDWFTITLTPATEDSKAFWPPRAPTHTWQTCNKHK